MVTFILGVVASIVASVIFAELDGWGPILANRMLEWAVRKLPKDRRSRYYEEWSAVLSSRPTSLSKLLEGFSIALAGIRMRIALAERSRFSFRVSDTAIRAADIFGATCALVFLAPLFAVIAVAIRITDPGPVLFAQIRIGRNGRQFRFFKFRTMRTDIGVDDYLNYVRTVQARPRNQAWGSGPDVDPRITSIGLFLRRTGLDELPQLLNVLTGSMSFVGPRPMMLYQAEPECMHWREYPSMRPGMTGFWLVDGQADSSRSDEAARERHYARNRSLRLYLSMLIRTVRAALSRRPPY